VTSPGRTDRETKPMCGFLALSTIPAPCRRESMHALPLERDLVGTVTSTRLSNGFSATSTWPLTSPKVPSTVANNPTLTETRNDYRRASMAQRPAAGQTEIDASIRPARRFADLVAVAVAFTDM
jgi:hypothetical protein